ncbi:MAG: M16 family metallopeptidase [Campylobacterales bacterium]
MANTLLHLDIGGVKVPVIFEEDRSLPTLSLKVIFLDAGSIKDGDKSGISKLSFRLLNEGTKKLGSTKFATLLDEKAIKLSAYSGFETAGIEFSCLKEYADEAVKLTKELLKDPNYSEDTLSKIKLITASQIAKREDDFDHVADAALKKEIFKGTPLENDSVGTKESVAAISLADVKNFLASNITLANSVVVIGGDIDKDEAFAYTKAILEGIAKGAKNEQGQYFAAKSSSKEIKTKKKTEQAYIYFGAPANIKAADKEAYKARLAGFILGSSGFGSRLMEIIRVKNGLAYSAYGRFNLSKSHSYFSGHLQTKPQNEEKAKELVKKTIEEFVKDGVTQKELDGAKNFILGSEPLRAETLSQRLSRSFNEFYLGQKLGYHQEELELIKNTTLKELNDFIKAHPEITNLTVSVVTK